MANTDKPCRLDLTNWRKEASSGGLGFKVVGRMPDGALFETGTVVREEPMPAFGATEIETLNWRYMLIGDENGTQAGNHENH